jgi:AraC family transcriptional regulator, transcriptional activator FtrA
MRADPAKARLLVAVLVADGLSPFELAVATDVFGEDRSALGVPWYRCVVCAPRPGLVSTDAGFGVDVPHGPEVLARADLIVIPPTAFPDDLGAQIGPALVAALGRGARLVSLCTGAFVLAAAGLLAGRRAATHWAEAAELARRFPEVTVDASVLYVDEGDILTSAGSAASIDLCLHVVRGDFGTEIATQVARDLVVAPHRDGGQAQYIEMPMPEVPATDPFARTLAWLQAHLDEPVTIEDLAARSAMSPRTFARKFRSSTATTPYQWLLRQRVARAQRLLETSDASIDLVASESGFGTAANLRKHFRRVLRTSPDAYRRSFRLRAV